jgi:NifB/MoaA-like Fe-S oxidoreductase
MRRRLGAEFCLVSDELAILAGKGIPPASYYGDFGQRENGVGLVRSTLMHFETARPRGRDLKARGVSRVWILTGESFAPVLREELPGLQGRLPEVELSMIEVKNSLFGRPTTVAGLLAGKDLLESARPHVGTGDLVLVPDESVNENGVFIDDLSPRDLAGELGADVVPSWDPILAAGDAAEDLDVSSITVGAVL